MTADHHPTVNFLHRQVTNPTMRRFSDARLNLLSQRQTGIG